MAFYEFLGPAVNSLSYWGSEISGDVKLTQGRKSKPKDMSFQHLPPTAVSLTCTCPSTTNGPTICIPPTQSAGLPFPEFDVDSDNQCLVTGRPCICEQKHGVPLLEEVRGDRIHRSKARFREAYENHAWNHVYSRAADAATCRRRNYCRTTPEIAGRSGHPLSLKTILCSRTMLGWTFRGNAYCQLIRHAKKQKRLDWAKQYKNEAANNGFKDIIWTDESSIQLESHYYL